MDLRQTTVKGAFWSGISSWSENIITLGTILVLARLLEPKDFGIVAFASVFAFFVNSLITVTFNQTLVQRKDLQPAHLDSSFWMAIALASLAALALGLAAAPLSELFRQPPLAAVLPWLSLLAVVHALYVVQESCMMRELRFRPIALRGLIAGLAGGALGIGMALHGYGVWSLVGLQLARVSVSAIVMWTISSWRPNINFSFRCAKELLSFGKYIMGNSLLNFVKTRSDAFIIGTILGPAALGMYNVGYRVFSMLLTGGTGTIIRVVFSTFSKLQNDAEKLRTALTETLRFAGLLIIPTFAGIAVVADEAVAVLLGEKWLEAVEIVRLLAVAAIFQFTASLNVTLVVACGKASWQLYLSIVFTAVTVVAILLAAPFGITAVAGAVAITALMRIPCTIWMVRQVVPMQLSDYVNALSPAIIGSLAMAAAVLAVRLSWADAFSPAIALGLYILVGGISCGISLLVVAPRSTLEALDLAKKALFQRAGAPA